MLILSTGLMFAARTQLGDTPFVQASSFSSGSGTAADPFIITTPAQLDAVRNNLGAHYKLGNNIDMTDYLAYGNPGNNNGEGWLPIGDNNSPFTGNFDGNGHKITNIWIYRISADFVGLFGFTNDANVKDLGVEIVTAGISGNENIGGLMGVQDEGSITNSYATGNVRGVHSVGGLVGYQNGGSIANSYVIGNISGGEVVGGLVGVQDEGSIIGSYAVCDVNGNGWVGGLVGEQYGSIESSYATGNVSGNDRFVGGLVGFQDVGSITNSYATGNVRGNDYVGGLAGSQEGIIENSYATGNVTGSSVIGGLVGLQSDHYGGGNIIENSYAAGNVRGNENVGGLVGSQEGSITNCYATGNVRGNENVGGLVGLQDTRGFNVNANIIENSYAAGNVSGDQSVGGLAGSQYAYTAANTIKSCYATGRVSGDQSAGGLVGQQNTEDGGTNIIASSFHYQFATVNGSVIPPSNPDSAPNRRHGDKVTAAELMTKTTYTSNGWLFNDSKPATGPWHWDSRNFPKLSIGMEKFPFNITPATSNPVRPGERRRTPRDIER